MYPKPNSQQADKRSSSKREQLTDLLVNKFRNKYQVNLSEELELDRALKTEITKCVHNTHALTEKDLNDLDIVVATAVL